LGWTFSSPETENSVNFLMAHHNVVKVIYYHHISWQEMCDVTDYFVLLIMQVCELLVSRSISALNQF
jgi:hypothetical protein